MNQKWIFFGLLVALGLLALWCFYKKRSTNENYKPVTQQNQPLPPQPRRQEPQMEFLDEDDDMEFM